MDGSVLLLQEVQWKMRSQWKSIAFFMLLAVVLFFMLAGQRSNSMAGMDGRTGMDGMNGTDGTDAMGVMPLVESDMQDPLIDPMSLSMGHSHAGPASESPKEKEIRVAWSWPDGPPEAGQASKLVMKITDADGQPVERFDWNSEKLLHLVTIRKDLRQFQHIHPEYQEGGVFKLDVIFPAGGNYRLFADFIPSGLNELTRSADVLVSGNRGDPETSDFAEGGGSESRTQTVGDMEATLHFGHLMANMQTGMSFTFRDVATGKPVEDLQPYLGSVGHVIVVDADMKNYLHVHPVNVASTGPQALFSIAFPGSGSYKLWGQFKRNGEVLTIPFAVTVP